MFFIFNFLWFYLRLQRGGSRDVTRAKFEIIDKERETYPLSRFKAPYSKLDI